LVIAKVRILKCDPGSSLTSFSHAQINQFLTLGRPLMTEPFGGATRSVIAPVAHLLCRAESKFDICPVPTTLFRSQGELA
jgi:hypothetical protein